MKNACKIIATLGPATASRENIEMLITSGVDVFRLNFSHGNFDSKKELVDIIRSLEDKYEKRLGILGDLQGPKLRVGSFIDVVTLIDDSEVTLKLADSGDKFSIGIPHPEIFAAMQKDSLLFIDDGNIKLKILDANKNYATAKVLSGGKITSHKGINFPGVSLPISAMTDKDIKDLELMEKLGLDWIALSFVQHASDISYARSLMKSKAGLIAKIEKPSATDQLKEIIELSDGIMVARGDLGVELGVDKVPVTQKRIISECRKYGKPVIVATQMLESMIHNSTPTRAEASDVATAVFDRADAVMLSAETAIGKYPALAVQMMKDIIINVETNYTSINHGIDGRRISNADSPSIGGTITAIASVAATMMENADAIINFTATGRTTLKMAKERPNRPILSITPNIEVARKLSLVWGVTSVIHKELDTFSDMVESAVSLATKTKLAKAGDQIVITAGIPLGTGETNLLHIVKA